MSATMRATPFTRTGRAARKLFLLLPVFVRESDPALCLDAEIGKVIFLSEAPRVSVVMTGSDERQ